MQAPNPPGMKSSLYRFQRRALAWMQWREDDETPLRHDLSIEQMAEVGLSLKDELPPVRGGLLADEMGLGKTVVSIALMVATKKRISVDQQQMGSPSCETSQDFESKILSDGSTGATLVVCPPALVQQWMTEIAEHTGNLLCTEAYAGLTDEARKKEASINSRDKQNDGKRIRRKAQALNKGHIKMYGRVTAEMIREAEMYMRMQAGDMEPVVDMDQLAQELAESFSKADVVITSFDVLQREVHYDSNHNRRRQLRHPKRYVVPDSPLLRIKWHRVIVDEAQMVGPFSNAGEMMERIRSRHRWCVSGTPMNSGNELNDLRGMLTILQHGIFSASLPSPLCSSWNKFIAEPLYKAAKEKENGDVLDSARQAWELLCCTLRPLGWRNTKAVVVAEMSLPPRSLHLQNLRFHPAEVEFYSRIKDELRKNREELQQSHEVCAAIDEEKKSGNGQCANHENGRTKKRRRADPAEKVRENARACLTQLRLACIHPQLTQYWSRVMSSDLQLGHGGMRSLEEILERLVEKQAEDLQEAERKLCSHLNTLGMLLLQPRCLGSTSTGGEDSLSAPETTGSSSPPQKKRRRTTEPPLKEAVQDAIELLETSFKICEKGIDAASVPLEDLDKIHDPTSTVTASWMAWKRVQINVAHQIAEAYKISGDYGEENVKKFESEEAKRSLELRESAEEQYTTALKGVLTGWQTMKRLLEEAKSYFEDSVAKHFPISWGEPPISGTWKSLTSKFSLENVSRDVETMNPPTEEQLESSIANFKEMSHDLDSIERLIQADVSRLEAWKISQDMQSGIQTLEEELAAVGGLALDAKDQRLTQLRWKMGGLAKLLSNHKENKIRNRYDMVLPIPMPRLRRRQGFGVDCGNDSTRPMREENVALQLHLSGAIGSSSGDGSGETVLRVDDPNNATIKDEVHMQQGKQAIGTLPKKQDEHCVLEVSGRRQNRDSCSSMDSAWSIFKICQVCKQASSLPSQVVGDPEGSTPNGKDLNSSPLGLEPFERQNGLEYWSDFDHELVEDLVQHNEVSNPKMLSLADASRPFIPCETWKGRLPCRSGIYAFKNGDQGTGYYFQDLITVQSLYSLKEKPQTMPPLSSLVQECGLVLLSALRQHKETLSQRLMLSDSELMNELEAEAIISRLRASESQLAFIRHLRSRQRVAEQRLLEKLKGKQKADHEAASAANSLLVTNVQSHDALRQKIDQLFVEAKTLKQKRNYAKNQLAEMTSSDFAAPIEEATRVGLGNDTSSNESNIANVRSVNVAANNFICPRCANLQANGCSDQSLSTAVSDASFIGPTEMKVKDHGRECPVCREVIKGEGFIWEVCSHSFCVSCTETMFLGRFIANCPVCRVRHTKNQTIRVLAGRRTDQDASAYDLSTMTDRTLASVQVKGQWSSKISAIVRRILALGVTAVDEKVLVFSQFPEALKVVRRALMMNDVRYVELTANKRDCDRALKIFHTDDSVKVLLLSLRRGAQGLTLTRANHVMLLEPALEPAIEQQAISRVHRVGQKRPVRILRFIVEESIEEEVLRIQEERHVGMMHDPHDDGATVDDNGNKFGLEDMDEEEADAPTTVPSLTKKETLNEQDAQRLIQSVLI